MTKPRFGGSWTTDKLERVRRYLEEYVKIFNSNPRARYFNTIYVDAFAGAGYISRTDTLPTPTPLFPELTEQEAVGFVKGSAQVALEVEPSFDQFLFIEQDSEYAKELQKLKKEFPKKASNITIIESDANTYLLQWCKRIDWTKTRAVLFLDPYGMQVEWSIVEMIAKTRGIDLWYLFPAGAINRLLPKQGRPPKEWQDALTRCLGTNEWEQVFYSQEQRQHRLFNGEETHHKEANLEHIGQFVISRLKTAFPGVAKTPLWLRNSKNVPLFLLCFAAGNPKGAVTAVKIAEHILEKKARWRRTPK